MNKSKKLSAILHKRFFCPVRDHRGNGKIERLIRTINERLRINKNIILKKDNSGLSGILYILRIGKKADGTSPFEKSHGGEPNTVKSNIVNEWLRKPRGVLEQDSKATFAASDFEEEIDSTITFLPQGKKKATKLAMRDVAKATTPPQRSRPIRQKRRWRKSVIRREKRS